MSGLTVTSVTVRFRDVVAVDAVDLRARAGEIVGLIGPNGSGKTSLLDAISGFEPYEGTVEIDGEVLEGPPYRRARRGLGRTFQSLDLLEDLSVAENVGMGRHGDEEIRRALAIVDASIPVDGPVTGLGNAPRRLVALARSLAGKPRVLLVDEVAAGIDSVAQAAVARVLRSVADDGVAVVLVDHDLDLVLGVADHVVVLDRGRVVAQGPPREVRDDRRMIAAYLGDEA